MIGELPFPRRFKKRKGVLTRAVSLFPAPVSYPLGFLDRVCRGRLHLLIREWLRGGLSTAVCAWMRRRREAFACDEVKLPGRCERRIFCRE